MFRRLFQRGHRAAISFDNDGFKVRGRHDADIPWSSIAEIVAFKADLWAVDQICLGIRVAGSDEFLRFDEDWLGYKELLTELERRYDLLPNWWSRIAFPAFAENWTRIWPPPPPTTSSA